jgi:hypothetical protein
MEQAREDSRIVRKRHERYALITGKDLPHCWRRKIDGRRPRERSIPDANATVEAPRATCRGRVRIAVPLRTPAG